MKKQVHYNARSPGRIIAGGKYHNFEYKMLEFVATKVVPTFIPRKTSEQPTKGELHHIKVSDHIKVNT